NEVDARLGRAIGDGIVTGLEVAEARSSTRTRPIVSVAAGLAVNRCGNTLLLANAVDVALVRGPEVASTNGSCFAPCRGLDDDSYIAGDGVYVLLLSPACSTEGRVATSGLDPGSARCNTDTDIAAVQFRLIEVDSAFTQADMSDVARLRNRVAYACFGAAELPAIETRPFG